jgi:hypothetical protein
MHLVEQIESLFRLSALLRRPAVTGKYFRSSTKSSSEEGLFRYKYDLRHVHEKIREWQGLSLASKSLDDDDPIVPIEEIWVRNKEEEHSDDYLFEICRRLARANTRRRAQLDYWDRHPDYSGESKGLVGDGKDFRKEQPQQSAANDPLPLTEPKQIEDDQGSGKESEPQAEHIPVTEAGGSKATTSKRSSSTVARSALDDAMTFSGRPRTVYARSAVGPNATIVRVPDVPRTSSNGPTFVCPYCRSRLDSPAMVNRDAWK